MSTDEKVIAAIKNLPDNDMLCRGALGRFGNHADTGITTDDLKALAARIVELEALLDAADYIQLKDGPKLLRYSNTGEWTRDDLPWREFNAPAWSSATEAFKSLQASKEEKGE